MGREIYDDEERERKVVEATKEEMIKFISMFNYAINEEDLKGKKLTDIRNLYQKTKAERKKRTKMAYQKYENKYLKKERRTYADNETYDYEEDYNEIRGHSI